MELIRGLITRWRLARPRSRNDDAIARALDSPEGRVALAQAMIEPIKTSLEYQGVGRRLLMVDELPGLMTTRAYSIGRGLIGIGVRTVRPPAGFVRVRGSSIFAPYSICNGTVGRFLLVSE